MYLWWQHYVNSYSPQGRKQPCTGPRGAESENFLTITTREHSIMQDWHIFTGPTNQSKRSHTGPTTLKSWSRLVHYSPRGKHIIWQAKSEAEKVSLHGGGGFRIAGQMDGTNQDVVGDNRPVSQILAPLAASSQTSGKLLQVYWRCYMFLHIKRNIY